MAHALNRHGMVGSMGRVASAGDNAAMESFWSLLQTNVLNQRRRRTRQALRLAIVVWIERKYHRQRPQDSLGGLTPIEYEATITPTEATAAYTETDTDSCITPRPESDVPESPSGAPFPVQYRKRAGVAVPAVRRAAKLAVDETAVVATKVWVLAARTTRTGVPGRRRRLGSTPGTRAISEHEQACDHEADFVGSSLATSSQRHQIHVRDGCALSPSLAK
jgi:hypothetical protein